MKVTATTKTSLLPLLKWTGGKRSEISVFKANYPENIQRILEPFSGGAAVAFDLNCNSIVLNDLNKDLVALYRAMKTANERDTMLAVVTTIDLLRKKIKKSVCGMTKTEMKKVFVDPTEFVEEREDVWITGLKIPSAICTQLKLDLLGQLKSKSLKRIPALEKKRKKVFTFEQRKEHVETALQAGVYTTMRRIVNAEMKVSGAWGVGAWWLVRALCYSGMFRYGAKGNFNVPYGGIAYNSRDFSGSTEYLSSAQVESFFSRTEISELDFEELFKKYSSSLGAGDFVFVDPPYDSAFSKYNADGDFGQEDQNRLAASLKKLKVPWMLVIKNTPFILSLYQGKGLWRGGFGKKYGVNFRNRHDRNVEHLVVTNYPLKYAKDGEIGLIEIDLR
jgi:DNA adenine methylase